MPRPKNEQKPIKRRSRGGCHNCKRLKVKCDEQKPTCGNCERNSTECDYSLKLSWGGRPYKKPRIESSNYSVTTALPEQHGEDDDEEQVGDMSSVKRSFKNIATIFVPSPLQEEVNDSSFITETPSVHYLPTYKRKQKAKQAKPSLLTRQESSTPSDVTDNFTPESLELSTPANHSKKKPEESDLQEPKEGFSNLEDESITLADLPSLPIEPFSDLTFDFDLYDFSKDFTISDEVSLGVNHSYHNALMTLPLRDSMPSSAESYSVEEEESEGDDIITIPRPLETFPDILKDVPLYRDLFHHFIHVTANFLVPAPDLYPQNPFRTLLPVMALGTPHLLDLILAYAAAHRARFLQQETPVHLISRLLGRVFLGLTSCLENQTESQSDTTLTTAIMLSSYEILTGAGDASWKQHLHGARDIVVARGMLAPFLRQQHQESSISTMLQDLINYTGNGKSFEDQQLLGPQPLSLLKSPPTAETDVSYFLVRWFAYIDVIAALSSAKGTALMSTNENMAQLWALHDWSIARLKERDIDDLLGASEFLPHQSDKFSMPVQIDLFLGMDLDMLPVFAKVAHLTRQRRFVHDMYDTHRILELKDEEVAARERALQDITSEALELADLVISFCDACELRRTQYINNAIAEHLARRDRLSRSPGSTSSTSPSEALSPESATLAQLSMQEKLYIQLCVMNVTFCYAVLIQLYRRVLLLESSDSLVQNVVMQVTDLLDTHIPLGSAVESCMSFPIFIAACEALDAEVRERYWVRMKKMERFGVGQVRTARETMELTWQRNVSWVEIMEENNWEIVLA